MTTAKTVKENSIGWMVKLLSLRYEPEIKKNLKLHNLNLGQFAILMTLLEKDNISQTDIGKKISMPGYATTRNIDFLETKGLLERKNNKASRRSYCIQLTNEGKALAPTLFLIVKDVNEKLLLPLDKNEIETLKGLLWKLLFSR